MGEYARNCGANNTLSVCVCMIDVCMCVCIYMLCMCDLCEYMLSSMCVWNALKCSVCGKRQREEEEKEEAGSRQ